jgi:hypothetical protein
MATVGHKPAPIPDFKSYPDFHRYCVFHDPEFIGDVRALKELEKQGTASPGELKEFARDIAEYHGITVGDINRYFIGEILPITHETKTTAINFDPASKQFSLHFKPQTTKAEIIEEFEIFERLRKTLFPLKPTKRKMPLEPKLVFAIHKHRQHGRTFARIFERYQAGELPGGNTRFETMYELRRYYYDNKPSADQA